MSTVPKRFPPEFRRDVIAVARKGEASVSRVARDFGISESCLQRWLKIADREDGLAPPASSDRGGSGKPDESAELRELRRRNNAAGENRVARLCAQQRNCRLSRVKSAGSPGCAWKQTGEAVVIGPKRDAGTVRAPITPSSEGVVCVAYMAHGSFP
ncbi:transposase [Blastococcus sp. HT6-30]|uniref:transposase n=1 Tax=Blastococcus sp. HT6-30 TaxID=3144843 RepID=UPI00321B86D1